MTTFTTLTARNLAPNDVMIVDRKHIGLRIGAAPRRNGTQVRIDDVQIIGTYGVRRIVGHAGDEAFEDFLPVDAVVIVIDA